MSKSLVDAMNSNHVMCKQDQWWAVTKKENSYGHRHTLLTFLNNSVFGLIL